jgi:hypothetical protein
MMNRLFSREKDMHPLFGTYHVEITMHTSSLCIKQTKTAKVLYNLLELKVGISFCN